MAESVYAIDLKFIIFSVQIRKWIILLDRDEGSGHRASYIVGLEKPVVPGKGPLIIRRRTRAALWEARPGLFNTDELRSAEVISLMAKHRSYTPSIRGSIPLSPRDL